MLRRDLLLGVVAGWLLLAATGCSEGPLGEDGRVLVNFATAPSVSQVTLTGVGIDVVASVPDSSVIYRRKELKGRIDWQFSGSDYMTVVDVAGERGDNGDEGVLPAGSFGCEDCSPLVQGEGKDGDDERYTMLFTGTRILRFSNPHMITGT